ncbi:hypothetical protein COV04_01875 [Candidatus Uhrbacteria bacterium CG10_big_fil_rev_8_21_14_0_10_48_11]|uniref:HAD family hydrolase n=1 Tax=Candidatus Uhrbacteria bacterium CG10_big_fil_rev_8_21_14_0_10_48_11 TaxID=1975037 RepID=A0A2M8LF12_9BACT|nr:MAG: hypothetical protein COV04_01875 [Candidatus Uhrbacteria bacterium CG10_big_fil_rev_8_21_14_0_10_48_11]
MSKILRRVASQYAQLLLERIPIVGMPKLIRNLASDDLLSIVTSTEVKTVHSFLERYTLPPYFSDVFAAEHHYGKVNKMEYLLKHKNMSTEESLMVTDTVGDSREADKLTIRSVAIS